MAAGLGAASPRSGELDLFLRHDGDGSGNDPNADSLVMLPRVNGVWRSPVNIGGFVHRDSEIAATSRVTGEITIAVRWNDSSLRTRTWTDAGGWDGWNTVTTGLTGGPAIAGRGSNGLILTWRDANGRIRVTTGQPGGPWNNSIQLTPTVRSNTSPSVTTTSSNPKIAYTDSSTGQPRQVELAAGGSPINAAAWGAPSGLTSSGGAPAATTPSMGVVRMWAAPNGNVYRYSPTTSSGVLGTYPSVGSGVAGAAGVRSGESGLPSTPTSLWSNRLLTGEYQADAFWRTQDGCIATRTKTSTSAQAAWNTPSPAVFPAHPGTTRCTWPSRVGTAPLMKRLDSTEYNELAQADQSWRNASGSTMAAANSYVGRDQALVYHQGPDWPTSWALRNWHPNTWVYRKAIAYLMSDRLHDATATSSYFVRRKSNNRLVALAYGCSSSGCPQPLLNVASSSARLFWLFGSSSSVVNQQGACQNQTVADGVLDILACTSGMSSSNLANAKGVWADEVLPQLTTSSNGAAPSFVADALTGVPLTNSEVLNDLPFSATQWQDGLATMMDQLRAGINTLKSQRVLRTDQGKVAINYKWTTYGFGGTPGMTITSVPTASRIIQASDYVELEAGWVDGGITGGGTGVPFSFQRRQQFVDQVHALGRNVVEEKVTCAAFSEFAGSECTREGGAPQTAASAAAHYTTAQYNLASTYLNYANGDMVGDLADYYARSWDGYSTDLGVALAGRTALTSSTAGPQQRLFERGRVIVVPPGYTGSTTFSVPVGSRWRPTGSNTLTTVTSGSITLAPRRGAVILNP
ncbi:MAG: hypothetical protein J7513_13390 [Solirubrobacteraceae bacterium]|nr:hypothetical protein [Solirubrobacteraceae bacterium]